MVRLGARYLFGGLACFGAMFLFTIGAELWQSTVSVDAKTGGQLGRCSRCWAATRALSCESGSSAWLCNECRVKAGDFDPVQETFLDTPRIEKLHSVP